VISVLTGGEAAAMTVINGVVRLLPGTSVPLLPWNEESHTSLLLEHPHYNPAQPAFAAWTCPRCLGAAAYHGGVCPLARRAAAATHRVSPARPISMPVAGPEPRP